MSWVAPPQGSPDNQITGYELVYRRADDIQEVFLSGTLCLTDHFFDGWLDDNKEHFSIKLKNLNNS